MGGIGRLSSLVVCAGGGGLALGLEQSGFTPELLLDNWPDACRTIRMNRPEWDVREVDLLDFDPVADHQIYDVDLRAAGLPRLKATAAVARTRDPSVELELVRAAIFLMHGVQPRALLIDNVPDLVTSDAYAPIRSDVESELEHHGYAFRWLVVNAVDFGIPQDRKHGVLVACEGGGLDAFDLPDYLSDVRLTVGLIPCVTPWPHTDGGAPRNGRRRRTVRRRHWSVVPGNGEERISVRRVRSERGTGWASPVRLSLTRSLGRTSSGIRRSVVPA